MKKDAEIASLQEDTKKPQEAAAGNLATEGDNSIARTANLQYSHDDSGETDAADGKPLMLLSQHFAKMVKGLDFYSKQVSLVELVSYLISAREGVSVYVGIEEMFCLYVMAS